MKTFNILSLAILAFALASFSAFAQDEMVLDGMKIRFKSVVEFGENKSGSPASVQSDRKEQCGGFLGQRCDYRDVYDMCRIKTIAGAGAAPKFQRGMVLELRWESERKTRMNLVVPGTNEIKAEMICMKLRPLNDNINPPTEILTQDHLTKKQLEGILGATIEPAAVKQQSQLLPLENRDANREQDAS